MYITQTLIVLILASDRPCWGLEPIKFTSVSAVFISACKNNQGTIILNDACYIHVGGKATYNDATSYCAARDSYLLSVTTPEERLHLNFQSSLSPDETWLGLNEVVASKYLQWSDGVYSSLYSDQLTDNWTLEHGSCPAVVNNGSVVVFRPCTDQYSYVCKSRYYAECYPSWMYDPQKKQCYRMFGTDYDQIDPNGNHVTELPQLSSDQAKVFCQNYLHGHLVAAFSAAFSVANHPYWQGAGKFWQAWVGVFYHKDSNTGFVRDDGTEVRLDEPGFFVSSDTPSLYLCSYYQNSNLTSSKTTFIAPADSCEDVKFYLCEVPTVGALKSIIKPPSVGSAAPTCLTVGSTRTSWYRLIDNARLADNVMHTSPCTSRIDCAIQCSNYPGCKSFNFNYNDELFQCELNNEGGEQFKQPASQIDFGYLNCNQTNE